MLKRLFIAATIMFASITTADALESVAIDDSVLNPALQGRLSLLEAKLNDAYALMAKIKNCNARRLFYREGASTTGECVRLNTGGGRRITDTNIDAFVRPPICMEDQELRWSTLGWLCVLRNSPPLPLTCEMGTETLFWNEDSNTWSCATITAGNNGSNGEDGSNGSGSNSNTNINNNNNTIIIGGGSTPQPVNPAPTDPVGTCKLKKKVNWECTSTGAGHCLQTFTEVPECGCKPGYRRKAVTSAPIYKKYLCILD